MTSSGPHISIVLPGIRKDRWLQVYESILASTSRSFELVIGSPYSLPADLEGLDNVKHVKDWGSPVRASCIASTFCEGSLITWTADDAVFLPGALDKNIDFFEECYVDARTIVVSKYFEGEGASAKPLQHDDYFKICGSPCTNVSSANIDWWLFNVAIMERSYFEKLGGWDCKYEGTFMSHTDLAMRAQADGAQAIMSRVPLLDCGHMPGRSGDHAPIHDAQTLHDEPLFRKTYESSDSISSIIDRDNWRQSPAIWTRRFGRVEI